MQRDGGAAMVLVVVALARWAEAYARVTCSANGASRRLLVLASRALCFSSPVCCVVPLVALLYHLCTVVAWLLRSLGGGRQAVCVVWWACGQCAAAACSSLLLALVPSSSAPASLPSSDCFVSRGGVGWWALCGGESETERSGSG